MVVDAKNDDSHEARVHPKHNVVNLRNEERKRAYQSRKPYLTLISVCHDQIFLFIGPSDWYEKARRPFIFFFSNGILINGDMMRVITIIKKLLGGKKLKFERAPAACGISDWYARTRKTVFVCSWRIENPFAGRTGTSCLMNARAEK